MLSPLGQELLTQDEATARERLRELDREVRAARQHPAFSQATGDAEETADLEDDEDEDWRRELLATLHSLPPEGFEESVTYVLKAFGMELERVGGTGDEGIDGIGTAPISPVLSSRVAVQAKRIDPDGRPISRDVVGPPNVSYQCGASTGTNGAGSVHPDTDSESSPSLLPDRVAVISERRAVRRCGSRPRPPTAEPVTRAGDRKAAILDAEHSV